MFVLLLQIVLSANWSKQEWDMWKMDFKDSIDEIVEKLENKKKNKIYNDEIYLQYLKVIEQAKQYYQKNLQCNNVPNLLNCESERF